MGRQRRGPGLEPNKSLQPTAASHSAMIVSHHSSLVGFGVCGPRRRRLSSVTSIWSFDFRRRLVFGLLMGLLFTTSLGTAVACMLFRVSPWIWIIPLFVASIFAFVFVVRHG